MLKSNLSFGYFLRFSQQPNTNTNTLTLFHEEREREREREVTDCDSGFAGVDDEPMFLLLPVKFALTSKWNENEN